MGVMRKGMVLIRSLHSLKPEMFSIDGLEPCAVVTCVVVYERKASLMSSCIVSPITAVDKWLDFSDR